MSTDPKPDPFAELRNLLSENARLRARVEVLEYREKIGHAPHDHDALNNACIADGPIGMPVKMSDNTIVWTGPPDLLYGDQSHAVYPESEWDDNEPAAPQPSEDLDRPCRRCEECDGEDHHWCDANVGIAEDEPDHPAARYGHAAWYVCKHCPAWRAELDDEDEE